MRTISIFILVLFLGGLGCANDAATEKRAEKAIPVPVAQVSQVETAYLLGKFDPTKHPSFVAVGKPYTDKPGMYLHQETFEAFKKMFAAAQKDKINLKIISSTRTFQQQKQIWEGKWTRFAKDAPGAEQRARKILEYSAMPGTSRHHWGTDIDLNDLNNPAFKKGGKYASTYDWLQQHASAFGFCQPYTAKGPERPHGYEEERWHWSYTPLAGDLLSQYLQTIKNEMITGFQGAETATKIDAVTHFVAGINQNCKQK